MSARHVAYALTIAVAVIAGCDKKPEPKAGPVVPPADYKEKMEAASKAQREAAAKAAAEAQKRMGAAAATAGNAATDAAAGAQSTAADVTARVKADGQILLDRLDASIKANKLDEGQTYVAAFENIKDKVPAELKARYDTLKTELDTAKAKAAEPNK